MSLFEGITEFIAVAETQGFTAAARQLGVSTSHVSRRIADLESRLGIALVARTTRQVKLTPSGTLYYEHCLDLVNGIEQANEVITAGQIELSGLLRVTTAGEFSESHVVPLLLQFVEQHPKLNLELDYNTRNVNFVQENFDFAVRFGTLPDSNLIATKLADHQYVAAASPAYLARYGTPQTPEDLSQHSCVVTTYNRWAFQEKGKSKEVSVNGRVKANNVRTVLRACESGMGIAYMPKTSFAERLQDGRLQPVLEAYWKNRGATWIVYANRKYLPVRARLAIDYLLAHFRGS